MVDASDVFYNKQATLDFNETSVGATIGAKEGGEPYVELDQEIPQSSEPNNLFGKIEGITSDGEDVLLKSVNAVTGFDSGSGHKIRSIKSVREIEIDGIGGDAFVDEEVIINFDTLCFLPEYPIIHTANQFSIIQRGDWEAEGSYASDVEERVSYISARRHPIRTAQIQLKQEDQNGPPKVQLKKAQSRIDDILDLSSFLLGVGCSSFKAEIEKSGSKYIRIVGTHRNIGGAHTMNNLVWNDLRDLIDTAYDWYSNDSRPDYKLESVIGFYLDSINITRTVEGQLSTLYNGIELLAKRHSDYGPNYGSTPKRLEYIVDELDVKVSDLAKNSGVFPEDHTQNSLNRRVKEKIIELLLHLLRKNNRLSIIADPIEERLIRDEPIPEYFYSKSRQYVVHGDNHSTFEGNYDLLFADLESTRVFIQRLLRNRIFGKVDVSKHRKLGEMEPNEYATFN